ncbi:glycosyltransferase [bacterium]|jgi:glycosyltransferase involved in cell wall biosynthesis|nr:glycosyltransferase [bacterium]
MINIVSPINQLGYGLTGLNIVKSLNSITDVALWCIGQPQVTNQEDANIIQKCIDNVRFLDFKAPCIKIWHQHDMTQFAGNGTRIGFPIFELDTFNALEKHHLSSLDKIFVCSEWAKSVILNNIPFKEKNISIIPLGVDTTIFRPSSLPHSDSTIFFNCGKWEIRKGHDILIEIFNESFEEHDNVELWMMCDNPFCTPEEESSWKNKYLHSKLGSKIKLISRKPTHQEVYNIMSQTHCGIFPARAEGWNLELLEMMACGKPVITTQYAAHTQFCNTSNSYLIPINEYELAYDGKWFHKQGSWAKFGDKEKLSMIKHMQHIHTMRVSNTLRVNFQGIETAQQFTWNNSAKQILKNLF